MASVSGKTVLQPLTCRPHMGFAALAAVLAYVGTAQWIGEPVTCSLVAWDSGVLVFLLLSLRFMRACSHDQMKRRAIDHDEGRHLILLITILAAVASIWALIAELSAAKGHPGAELRVALAAATIILSWLFMQIVFALHYAHVYYLAEEGRGHNGGLEFNDSGEPDYWDFVHYAIIIGATAQTADIVIKSKEMRRIGTVHTLVAFGFNTAILATMINLAASLF